MPESSPNHTAPLARPGFRFSRTDAAVILLAMASTPLAWVLVGPLSLIIPIVLAHFFLFCNVFRVRRSFELLWSGAFVVNVALWFGWSGLSWLGIVLAQTPITATLIAMEIASPRYHGIGCAAARRPPEGSPER